MFKLGVRVGSVKKPRGHESQDLRLPELRHLPEGLQVPRCERRGIHHRTDSRTAADQDRAEEDAQNLRLRPSPVVQHLWPGLPEAQDEDKLPKMGEEEAIQLLASNGNLVKRPFVLTKTGGLVGFNEKEWGNLLK